MGPQKSLSGLIAETRSRTDEAHGMLQRLRDANRRLTGSTAESSTPLQVGDRDMPKQGEPPLMVALTTAMADLEAVMSELRNEVGYLEQTSETGAPSAETKVAAYR